jgi:hypothetical protein
MKIDEDEEIINKALKSAGVIKDTRANIILCKKVIELTRKEIIKMIEPNKIYPKDIFPELSKDQLDYIHNLLLTKLGFPLDRLSAHISRLILERLSKKLKEVKNE